MQKYIEILPFNTCTMHMQFGYNVNMSFFMALKYKMLSQAENIYLLRIFKPDELKVLLGA